MGELTGKVAIITGAGRLRGIGKATALELAKLGADIVVTGTNRDPSTFPQDEKLVDWRDIDSTAEQVRSLGRNALPLVVDVTNEEQVELMVEKTLQELGRVDILINNAAYARGSDRVSTIDLTPKILQKVLDVKVKGTFLCSKAVARVLLSQGQGGKIVTVSSTAGKSGQAQSLAYNAACFAQVGMTQSLASELGPSGINVNCVCPGTTDTARLDDIGRGEEWSRIVNNIPIGRAGTFEEVGRFIAYLCTEEASWIHGQSININGGQVMEL